MMKKRIVGHIDSNGEIHDGAFGFIFPKRYNGFQGGGWIAMSQIELMALASSNIGAEGYRVLFAVLSILSFDNLVQLNQSELSKEIGMKRENFSRAIKKLELEGILLRGPKIKSILTFRLNPKYGWKGSSKKHKEILKEKMDKLGISVIENEVKK